MFCRLLHASCYMVSMLIEYYGEECPHCKKMAILIERLKGEGFSVESYETWHNEENAKKFTEHEKGTCGGVPFFINTESGKTICGATDYETLKAWAEGK